MVPIGGAPPRRRGFPWWWILRALLALLPGLLLVGVAMRVGERLGRGLTTDIDRLTAAIAVPLYVGALLVVVSGGSRCTACRA